MKIDYYFHKPLFWFGFFIVVLFVGFAVVKFGLHTHTYEHCDPSVGPGGCYLDGDYVPLGYEFGEKPPWIISYGGWLMVGFFVLLFIINHLFYNVGGRKHAR